jgi:hypothetical protein
VSEQNGRWVDLTEHHWKGDQHVLNAWEFKRIGQSRREKIHGPGKEGTVEKRPERLEI